MTSNKFMNPANAAILGFLLFAPGAIMIAMLMLNFEPTFISRLIPPAPEGQPQVIGSLVALTIIVIFPSIGLALNLLQMRRIRQEGGSVLAYPLNVALVVACLSLIAALAIGIIIDQWPCWQGVPNCD